MEEELDTYSMPIQPESSKVQSVDSMDCPGDFRARSEKHIKEWKWGPRLKAQSSTQVPQ